MIFIVDYKIILAIDSNLGVPEFVILFYVLTFRLHAMKSLQLFVSFLLL